MKTIEERATHIAQEFGATKSNKERAIYRACIRMATEQRKIDDKIYEGIIAEECTASYESGLEQGRRDMINKACEWLGNYLMEIGCPDDWMRDSPHTMSGEDRFRKAMEE